jgi:hypothetical protein
VEEVEALGGGGVGGGAMQGVVGSSAGRQGGARRRREGHDVRRRGVGRSDVRAGRARGVSWLGVWAREVRVGAGARLG